MLLSLSFCITSFAEVQNAYEIDWVELNYYEDGTVKAVWDEASFHGRYMIKLQAKENGEWKNAAKEVSTADTEYDFTEEIAEIGRAYYRVVVHPVGAKSSVKFYSAENYDEGLPIDSSALKNIKNKAKQLAKDSITPGWQKLSDGNWIFYDGNKNLIKNGWATVDGFVYYLNSNGYMVTGWNAIDGNWYYLEPVGTSEYPQGARWSNAVTPDGYTVNKYGIYEKDGVEVTTKEDTVSGEGYKKVNLKLPEGFYINYEGNLVWEKVEGAARYQIDYYINEERADLIDDKENPFFVNTELVKLSRYGIEPCDGGTIKISACSINENGNYTKTKAVEIAELDKFAEEHTINGKFSSYEGKIRFKDIDGNTYKGWKNLGGYWFFLDDDGCVYGPGWLENNGYRYYFNKYGRMLTGKQTIDSVEYVSNDGSDSSLPLGALKTN